MKREKEKTNKEEKWRREGYFFHFQVFYWEIEFVYGGKAPDGM